MVVLGYSFPACPPRVTFFAPVLLAALALLTGCSAERRLEQSALDPASPDAALVAELGWWMFAVAGVVLLLVLVLVAAGLLRGRIGKGGRPLGRTAGWALVIAGGGVLPLAAILALVTSGSLIARNAVSQPGEDAITIEVSGRLWWWEFRYLDEVGAPIVVTANEIHLPAGRPVRFLLRSDNVIHSFWVPNLRGKTDMIPGKVNEIWMRPAKVGTFRGQCAEFCGTQHALMGFFVVVEPQERFAAWLGHQARPAAEPGTDEQARGRDVFLSAGCGSCHTIRGTPADGGLGPELTHFGSRLSIAAATVPNTRGHLGGWIADPQHIKPGNLMPSFALPPPDLLALLRYLEALD
ncbi:MAG TPA: cytochrome c oxidase subunit II [Falsiroseomonas sp.]|jgi:cytochrome c oxidase subunit 2|nr:cytochrome c oxidase subunit II [Falsiroseomonas sp.]